VAIPRLLRFGSPQPARPQQTLRQPIVEPVLGLDARAGPMDMQPGFTPDAQNFIKLGNQITPRSGLSAFTTAFAIPGPALYAAELLDTEGQHYGFAASAQTLAWFPPGASWSTLSYIAGVGSSTQTFDSSRYVGIQGAHIYDITTDRNIAVLTNNRQFPVWFSVDTSNTTYSNFTEFASLASRARAVEAYDARLVWFNLASSASTFATRVMWSVRGAPKDYTIASGAGYEDLMDMRGAGTRLITDGDELVLFTDSEIWRARKRGDIYAFDFYPVVRNLGCTMPRTVVRTPAGIAFMGTDRQVYVLAGSELVPIDQTQGDREGRAKQYIREHITNASTIWAAYNAQTHNYELYFSALDGASIYPTKALYFSLDNSSVWPQRFAIPITAGFSILPHYEGLTWNQLKGTWDELVMSWDELTQLDTKEPRVIAISSNGTPYALHPSADSDAGSVLEARWRSHGLSLDPASFDYAFLSEVWAEYTSDSASSTSAWISIDGGQTFTTPYEAALSASSNSVAYLPVRAHARGPQFEIRVTNGKPRFSRFRYRLAESSQH
jgi:hypothetical protein